MTDTNARLNVTKVRYVSSTTVINDVTSTTESCEKSSTQKNRQRPDDPIFAEPPAFPQPGNIANCWDSRPGWVDGKAEQAACQNGASALCREEPPRESADRRDDADRCMLSWLMWMSYLTLKNQRRAAGPGPLDRSWRVVSGPGYGQPAKPLSSDGALKLPIRVLTPVKGSNE
jgi:hypothetical protein